jgi:hypothetical protein
LYCQWKGVNNLIKIFDGRLSAVENPLGDQQQPPPQQYPLLQQFSSVHNTGKSMAFTSFPKSFVIIPAFSPALFQMVLCRRERSAMRNVVDSMLPSA